MVVRSVDARARRIALVPAPDGLAVGARGQQPSARCVGAIVTGMVDRVETYGVFLQIEGTRGRAGRGLIPNAELGTPRGADTRKLFPAGMKLTAKVLETGEGKLRLSIKAVEGRRRARRLRRLPRDRRATRSSARSATCSRSAERSSGPAPPATQASPRSALAERSWS